MNTSLAVVLWTHKGDSESLPYKVYEVLGEMFEGWPDDRKADLYALLAEKLSADMTFEDFEHTVGVCMAKNAAHFNG